MLAVITAVGTALLGGGKKLLSLLGKLNIWQLLCIALFATSAVFFVQRNVARGERDSALVNLREVRAELKSISDKRNEQAETTRGNIKQAEKNEREGKRIADEIRNAPIPPDCRTPGLDIMRNEI